VISVKRIYRQKYLRNRVKTIYLEKGLEPRRWVDNIKMDLRTIGWDGVDWIDLAQDRDQWRALV
jgi:hypothetical protein